MLSLKKYIKEHKNVLKNFMALLAIQGANFVIPLIILPYIIPTIGFENFGVIGWIQVIVTYFGVFTDYGFNILATRNVALAKEDSGKLSEIFSRVFKVKFLLCLLSALLIIILILLVPSFRQEYKAILLSFSWVVGQMLIPIWFFQGIEKMFWLTLISVISKVCSAIFIFIMINHTNDYIYFLFFLGIGNIIAGLLAILIAIKYYKIRWVKVSLNMIYKDLKEGWNIFTSNIAVTSIMLSNLLILNFFESDKKVVGYYTMAEKIIFAVWQLLIVFSQAIYPHLCRVAIQNHIKVKKFHKYVSLPFIFFILSLCLIMFFKADFIVFLITKETIPQVVDLLKIMLVIPFIVVLNIPFYQTLLVYDLKNPYSKVMIATFFFNLIAGFILIQMFSEFGTALSFIFTQIFHTSLLIYTLESKHPSKRLLF